MNGWTSYGKACFKREESIAAPIEFAKVMRERDRSLKRIGWGDSGRAGDLVDRAGEHLDCVAVHMMGQSPMGRDTVLRGNRYQAEPERASKHSGVFHPREQALPAGDASRWWLPARLVSVVELDCRTG